MDSKQSGFRSGFCSLDGISRLENTVRVNQAEGTATLAIFLDITKAFESVNHNLLFHKLLQKNISGNLARFIYNFLQNRTIVVRNGNVLSKEYPVPIGLPQGSVISPTLFNLFTADLLKDIQFLDFDYSKYADDIAVWVSDKDTTSCITKIQKVLSFIESWSNLWGLYFSGEKSKAMFFTKRRIPKIPIKLNGASIELVNKHKFLGLTLDRNLTWKYHIQDLKNRCESDLRLIRIISSNNWGADAKTLRMLYISLIQSKLSYGLHLVGTTCKTHLNTLNIIKSKALRTILGAIRCTQTDHLNIVANIKPLDIISKIQLAKYTLRVMANKLNPLRSIILNYSPPVNRRCLKYPIPLCGRILKTFENLPLKYYDVAPIPYIELNVTYPFCAFDSLHIFNKDRLDDENWQSLYKDLLLKYPNYKTIFCDGSVIGEKSGCGVFSSIFKCGSRLPNHTSIYTCELYAIFVAISFIFTHKGNFLILTDSLSAVTSLKYPYNSKHHLILKIASLISNAKNAKIIIEWVPSHKGIAGNESADKLAKDSLNFSTITQSGYNLAEAINIINNHYFSQFKKICNPCCHNNPISYLNKNCYPFPNLSRKEQIICSRLYLRVTKLTHLHLLTKSDPTVCINCNSIITLEHIFISCPNYSVQRQNLRSFCSTNNIPPNIDYILSGQIPLKTLLSFIKDANLLKEI